MGNGAATQEFWLVLSKHKNDVFETFTIRSDSPSAVASARCVLSLEMSMVGAFPTGVLGAQDKRPAELMPRFRDTRCWLPAVDRRSGRPSPFMSISSTDGDSKPAGGASRLLITAPATLSGGVQGV